MKKSPTIRDLYPDFTEEELQEAEDSLEHYLALVFRIFERLEAEGKFDSNARSKSLEI